MRYSLILPVRNGARYLKACAQTVLEQQYDDYELIISDNHSADGTADVLAGMSHPRLRKMKPPVPLSMVDHFEWTLSMAKGDWLMFLGVDDGVQGYFFSLAERFTQIAEAKNIRAIMSRRAYFFWPGCETYFGESAVAFSAVDMLTIENAKWQICRCLSGFQNYFELPQMYSNSLFTKGLLNEARNTQGRVFTSLTPDANLAAVACSLERRYLRSEIPLGWVGTSPASNGFSIAVSSQESPRGQSKEKAIEIAQDFSRLNSQGAIRFHRLAGNILLGSGPLLLWEALLQTTALRSRVLNMLIKMKPVRLLIISLVLAEVSSSRLANRDERISMIKDLKSINKCGDWEICLMTGFLKILRTLNALLQSAKRRIVTPMSRKHSTLRYDRKHDRENEFTINRASREVARLLAGAGFLK